ncbi:RDD family protein [Sphingomonas panacisoli]|uniref:RDD family protein n=1 Tax=Sphingomonas panacisoli TaxID=1813879 RepID=A0A5B8LNB8_9SPHN|nr:RDD family protein [Sphingomonas panacisoli]QDZ08570.1 RDD family protein [Sphingomonas panacisoli]
MARPRKPHPATALRRSFVTPEGVDLKIELSTAGARAGAFMLDLLMMLAILAVATIVIGATAIATESVLLGGLWLIGFFFLRNGWFALFEMGGRGATPGKRIIGLRVVARDGSRLTGGAVIARNAMREIEFFLPMTFFFSTIAESGTDKMISILALIWSGIFLFFPLFNRDRLRVGDLLAGTWVVQRAKVKLGQDIVASLAQSDQPRRTFSDHALSLYGEYELQTLEEVLRLADNDSLVTVAAAIRRKADLPDDGDDYGFLSDYYAALCARLERQMMVGLRRADKYSEASRERAA